MMAGQNAASLADKAMAPIWRDLWCWSPNWPQDSISSLVKKADGLVADGRQAMPSDVTH